MSDRTELEWFEPADFFEAPYRYADADCDLAAEGGRVTATLRSPQDPVDAAVEHRIGQRVKDILLARQLQVHRKSQLEGPRILQHTAGKKHVSIRVGSAALVLTGGRADIVVTGRSGAVVRDTRAERIRDETAALDVLTAKAAECPTLRAVLDSYSRSVSDPNDELVHLYEVRDALSAHYGSEADARKALGIGKAEWQRLGMLANVEAIEQGRHRGKYATGRRSATAAELAEARGIVRAWITAFARLA